MYGMVWYGMVWYGMVCMYVMFSFLFPGMYSPGACLPFVARLFFLFFPTIGPRAFFFSPGCRGRARARRAFVGGVGPKKEEEEKKKTNQTNNESGGVLDV